MLRAGFAEVDITPPIGTQIIGWLKVVISKEIHDPLFARAAIFESDGRRIAFIQLDTLSVRWKQVTEIRERISSTYNFPGENILVAATHNHAGPAIMNCGEARRDDAYIHMMVDKIVSMFGEALSNLQEAEVGFGSCFEFSVSYNRRIIMRDGTVKTQAKFSDPNALCLEGPIDPEVAVLAARKPDGELLGVIVNFTCHPTHHGADGMISAGFPGALAAEMKSRGCPVTMFLNGASGNIVYFDARRNNEGMSMEEMGRVLADDVNKILVEMKFRGSVWLGCRSRIVSPPFRKLTEDEIKGTVEGAQRFVDPAVYDRQMTALVERIQQRGHEKAQVQALFLDEYAYVGIPAEYFVEHGLRIKQETYPHHTLIVGHANGMLGYIPHKDAFNRGGYETTFGGVSRMAPEVGDILADCAIELIHEARGTTNSKVG